MDLDDQELVQRARSDRRAGFDPLIQRYERLVYKVCSLYGPTREDTLDITQNVFLKAFRKLDGFRGESAFKTWLLRIAHHEGVNWIRSHRKHADHDDLETVAARLVSRAPQEEETWTHELRDLLQGELENLGHRSRLAISLRYFQQMRVREIAEILETSEGTVRSMLFRSLRKLRDTMAEKAHEVGP